MILASTTSIRRGRAENRTTHETENVSAVPNIPEVQEAARSGSFVGVEKLSVAHVRGGRVRVDHDVAGLQVTQDNRGVPVRVVLGCTERVVVSVGGS